MRQHQSANAHKKEGGAYERHCSYESIDHSDVIEWLDVNAMPELKRDRLAGDGLFMALPFGRNERAQECCYSDGGECSHVSSYHGAVYSQRAADRLKNLTVGPSPLPLKRSEIIATRN